MDPMDVDEEEPKRLTLQGKAFFFTYPRCEETTQHCLAFLQDNYDVKDYIIAEEKHEDDGMHLHAWFSVPKKIKVSTFKRMHLPSTNPYDTEVYKGDYQVCRSSYKVQRYCKKDGNFITNIEFDPMVEAVTLAKAGDTEGAFNLLASKRPQMVLQGGQRLKANLNMLAEDEEGPEETYKEFINVPPLMKDWDKNAQSLWLMGPSGYGKTEYAKSLGNNPLIVRHKDQLKGLTKDHDIIVFDDFKTAHWPRECVIHLTDLSNKSGIDVKHSHVIIPKGLPRVFTSNVWIWPEDKAGAIERRVFAVMIDAKLYEQAKAGKQPKKADDWAKMQQGMVDPWYAPL